MENILSDQEVEALLEPEGPAQASAAEERLPCAAIDLNVGSHRLSAWHKQLGLVDERLSRGVARKLLGMLHKPSKVSLEGMRLLRFGEYLDGLETPTGLYTYHLQPAGGTLLVVLDAHFVFSLVEVLFGGCGRRLPVSGRGFTRTEQRVIQPVLDSIVESIRGSWPQLASQSVEPVTSEHDPGACAALPANDVVMARRYSVAYEGGGGELQLVMASNLVEQLFQPAGLPARTEESQDAGEALQRHITRLNATVAGRVRNVSLTLGELLNLRSGDVLPIGSPEIVDVTVNGVHKFNARVGEVDGRVGLSLLGAEEDTRR